MILSVEEAGCPEGLYSLVSSGRESERVVKIAEGSERVICVLPQTRGSKEE